MKITDYMEVTAPANLCKSGKQEVIITRLTYTLDEKFEVKSTAVGVSEKSINLLIDVDVYSEWLQTTNAFLKSHIAIDLFSFFHNAKDELINAQNDFKVNSPSKASPFSLLIISCAMNALIEGFKDFIRDADFPNKLEHEDLQDLSANLIKTVVELFNEKASNESIFKALKITTSIIEKGYTKEKLKEFNKEFITLSEQEKTDRANALMQD